MDVCLYTTYSVETCIERITAKAHIKSANNPFWMFFFPDPKKTVAGWMWGSYVYLMPADKCPSRRSSSVGVKLIADPTKGGTWIEGSFDSISLEVYWTAGLFLAISPLILAAKGAIPSFWDVFEFASSMLAIICAFLGMTWMTEKVTGSIFRGSRPFLIDFLKTTLSAHEMPECQLKV